MLKILNLVLFLRVLGQNYNIDQDLTLNSPELCFIYYIDDNRKFKKAFYCWGMQNQYFFLTITILSLHTPYVMRKY